MFNIVIRIVGSVIGLLMVFMGCIWAMQGLGVGPSAILQGFMVNDIQWTIYGLILALLGIGLVYWSNRRRRAA